jgi:8-oxo-dGTP diphosphatase
MPRPRPAAIGIIFSHDHDQTQVLLIKRNDVPVWVLPGGGIESSESPEEALLREIWEETGLRVKIDRKVAEYSPLNKLASPTHLYTCHKVDGLLRKGCETAELYFFDLNKLPKSFFKVHKSWLEDALQNNSEVIKKNIDQVTYGELVKYFLRHPWHVTRFLMTRLGFKGMSKK